MQCQILLKTVFDFKSASLFLKQGYVTPMHLIPMHLIPHLLIPMHWFPIAESLID